MSSGRRWVVHGLMVVVLGGNLVSFVFNRQLWPYSQYPMFSDAGGADRGTFETLALVGEPVAGEEIWFESQGYLSRVISPMLVRSAFGSGRARRGMSGVQTQLRVTYDFYERVRSRGLTDAPPLKRLHLYTFRWTLRPDLANLRTPTRTLVATYTPDDRAAR